MQDRTSLPLGTPGITASAPANAAPKVELNPGNAPAVASQEFTRIPMSVPRRKMEVPEIQGFHCHWFLDRNVPRALQGGYEFVKADEISLNQTGVATPRGISGNMDMGTNIKIVGGRDEAGALEHQTLMKIRNEWWNQDQRALEERNASILSAIFNKEQILGSEQVSAEDKSVRYVNTALLNRPTRRAK